MRAKIHAFFRLHVLQPPLPNFPSSFFTPSFPKTLNPSVTLKAFLCSIATTLSSTSNEPINQETAIVGDPKDSADVFRRYGCSNSDISKIFLRQPKLLKADLTILQSKLKVLQSLGLTSSDLVKIIHCRPRFLASRFDSRLDERLDFLESVFGSREMLLKAIIRNPSLLNYDFHNGIKPCIALYQELGFSRQDLVQLLMSRPTLIPRTSLNDEKLDYIRRTGLSNDSKMYKYVVALIAISHLQTIREKIANLENFGISEDEVIALFGKSPMVLTISIDKVQRHMFFVIGTMKLSANVILKYPFLLYVNLETVLKPRVLLAGKIRAMGLLPQIKGPALLTALRMTEPRFFRAFVNCHIEHVAKELLEFYNNAKGVKRLGEASKQAGCKGFPI